MVQSMELSMELQLLFDTKSLVEKEFMWSAYQNAEICPAVKAFI